MGPQPGTALCLLVLCVLSTACRSQLQGETIRLQSEALMEPCMNFGIWVNCIENSVGMQFAERPTIVFPVIRSPINDENRIDIKRMDILPGRNTPTDAGKEIGTIEGRSRKKRKRMYLLLATAMIAAKAAAVATATAILLPLALKAITLLAAKSMLVGKMAILVASMVGMMRLMGQQVEKKTEVIFERHPHKRVDLLSKPVYRPHHGSVIG